MKQKYEHTFLYFILIYIMKLTYNDEYILLSFIVEIKIYSVSNTTSDTSIPILDKCTLDNNINK